jgi:hypothetical protein
MINLFKFIKTKKIERIFIPKENKFEKLDYKSSGFSINDIIYHLGYHPTQIHSYFGDYKNKKKIHVIGFEIFSDNIIFILTKNGTKYLKLRDIELFLKRFKFEDMFDSIEIKDTLLKGIEERTLKFDFLNKVLNLKNTLTDGEVYAEKIGVFLFFIEDYLVSFKFDNDLAEWTRYFKNLNPGIISNYAKEAKIYWNDDYDKIFYEVNSQCDALANVPYTFSNEFINLHKNKYGNINFFMLLVCHYGKIINIDEFKTINKGRFESIQSNKFELGKFVYEFDKNGIIENIYRNNK